ncbi:hypothetical protein AVEN_213064-1 [Araneus ventricosus]|uniref:Uncharacterized protein n=1 Tax=Araneus ventricosus TaxID=182803 RepID=A0A4Y2WGG6_ARAVE|nr:hypothetical protein AVEN_213064-1 [Araneus ventricosus]
MEVKCMLLNNSGSKESTLTKKSSTQIAHLILQSKSLVDQSAWVHENLITLCRNDLELQQFTVCNSVSNTQAQKLFIRLRRTSRMKLFRLVETLLEYEKRQLFIQSSSYGQPFGLCPPISSCLAFFLPPLWFLVLLPPITKSKIIEIYLLQSCKQFTVYNSPSNTQAQRLFIGLRRP